MEPVEYLEIAKRRWWLIAGLVAAALVFVYLITPARLVDDYEATHVLLVEGDRTAGGAGAANPEVVALWVEEGEVLARVANALDFQGDPGRLAQDVEATANRALGTVSITATDRDPERAGLVANTFAAEVVAHLEEREAQRQEEQATELAASAESLRGRIALLEAQIDTNPPDLETVTAERDALIRQLGDVIEAQEAAATPIRYSTLQEATKGDKLDRLPGTGSRTQRMLLAGAVALVLGFGLAIVLDRSDTRLRRRHDVEDRFGLAVIAEIPSFSVVARRRRLVISSTPDSAKAEAYRTLRSALMLVGRRGDGSSPAADRLTGSDADTTPNGQAPTAGREVIMVTSPAASEGKSTTVANLAVAYAETGLRVLVLSCDLWRSGIARRFKVKLGRGVSDFLSATTAVPLSRFVRSTTVPGVRIVTSGLAGRRRGGSLASQQRLIDEARGLADVVILDTTPVLTASLTRELATVVDSVVVVCRVGRTTAAEAERCRNLLVQLGAPTLGVVLVGVSAPALSDYFAYFTPRRARKPAVKRAKTAATRSADKNATTARAKKAPARSQTTESPATRPEPAEPETPTGVVASEDTAAIDRLETTSADVREHHASPDGAASADPPAGEKVDVPANRRAKRRRVVGPAQDVPDDQE